MLGASRTLDKPVPTLTEIPAVCTPSRGSSTTMTTASVAKPTPIQSGAATGYTHYYKVLDGDNCYDIANNFKVTLTEVRRLALIIEQFADPILSSSSGILWSETTALSSFSATMFALPLS